MLKSQTISCVWKCDKCGAETTSESNPYNRVIIQSPALSELIPACEVDLCNTCVSIISVQAVEDYLNSNQPQ